jgi:predicted nucleic acid-binding protein
VIVSDASTLIVLGDLGRWELLGDLFEEVIVPPAVLREISAGDPALPQWLRTEAPREDETLRLLRRLLDPGESEAIALALQKDLPLIIDEKKGRRIAQHQGIRIMGLLGVVYVHIRKGYMAVDEAETFLKEVRERGFRIRASLIDAMLSRVKEFG